jgi:anti-sigma B factor antagonist
MTDSDAVIAHTETLEDGQLVRLRGDIDFSRSPTLRVELMQLLNGRPARLVIDLSDVPYMDSSGVATLVEALQVQRKANAKLVLCNLQDKVRGIFEIARLDMVFTIAEDERAAVTA